MTNEDELQALREENRLLKALVAELLPLKEQLEEAQARIKELEERSAQDSRTSSKPPSSDGLGRLPRLSHDQPGQLSRLGQRPGPIWSPPASVGRVSAPGTIAPHGAHLRGAGGALWLPDRGRHLDRVERTGRRAAGADGGAHCRTARGQPPPACR